MQFYSCRFKIIANSSVVYLNGRLIMLHGSVIRMHMHAVVKSVPHNLFYSCMRLAAIV